MPCSICLNPKDSRHPIARGTIGSMHQACRPKQPFLLAFSFQSRLVHCHNHAFPVRNAPPHDHNLLPESASSFVPDQRGTIPSTTRIFFSSWHGIGIRAFPGYTMVLSPRGVTTGRLPSPLLSTWAFLAGTNCIRCPGCTTILLDDFQAPFFISTII